MECRGRIIEGTKVGNILQPFDKVLYDLRPTKKVLKFLGMTGMKPEGVLRKVEGTIPALLFI